MNFNINIAKKDKKIYAQVSIEDYYSGLKKDAKYIIVKECDIRSVLVEKKYSAGKLLKGRSLNNKLNRCEEVFVFEDSSVSQQKENLNNNSNTKRNRKNKRNVKKVLDKSMEDVIIEE
tara:strand:- start:464 stop:817 length:354 start_codon:yes stop_codon:yes gene_type:complete